VDDTGLYVAVPKNQRDAVSYAYANSASFRREYDRAHSNKNLVARIKTGDTTSGRRGETDVKQLGIARNLDGSARLNTDGKGIGVATQTLSREN